MQTLRLSLLPLALLSLALPADAQARRVDTAPVTRQHLKRELPLVGGTEAWQKTTLVSRVEGYLAEVNVERGALLGAGAAIARIDVPDLVAAADRARATADEATAGVADAEAMVAKAEAGVTVAQAHTELRLAEVSVATAEHNLADLQAARVRQLHAKGAATDRQLEEATGALEISEAQLVAARAAADAARATASAKEADVTAALAGRSSAEARARTAAAALSEAEVHLGFARLTNPYARALVTARHVDKGALALAGETAIVDVADVSQLRVFFDVPEPDAPHVNPGASISITLSAFPRSPIAARIARTAGALDERTRTMQAEVVLDNADGSLMPGMFCHATLTVADHPDAMTIPGSAIYARDGETWVLVADVDTARRIDVEVGLDDGRVVEILSGLEDTQRVILGRPTGLSDGDLIDIGVASN